MSESEHVQEAAAPPEAEFAPDPGAPVATPLGLPARGPAASHGLPDAIARLDPGARARVVGGLQRTGNHSVARILARDPPKDGAAPAAGAPAAATPAKADGLIVEDTTDPVAPEQLTRKDFLARLKSAASAAAEAALSGSAWAALARPKVQQQLEAEYATYAAMDAKTLESAMREFAPGAANAQALITAVAEATREQVVAGLPTGKPDEAGEGGGGVVAGAKAMVGKALDLLFKRRAGGRSVARDPAAVHAGLGAGHALPEPARGQMERAFGQDFSPVRVHTDATAGRFADDMDARAFTVGSDIAFGPGEFQPGNPVGDALLAHELAHVVQQRNAGSAPATDHLDEHALEDEADVAAVHAVADTYGAAGAVGGMSLSRLRSGLRLQRCDKKKPKPVATAPKAPPEPPDAPDKPPDGGPGTQVASGIKGVNAATRTADTGMHYWTNYQRAAEEKRPGFVWNDDYRLGLTKTPLLVQDKSTHFKWHLAPGAKPSAALKAFIAGLTIADCMAVASSMQYQAILNEVGEKKFDAYFGAENPKQRLVIAQFPLPLIAFQEDVHRKSDGKTEGDWYYFKNHPLYKVKHPGGIWPGENAIYVGNGLWNGFGAENLTEEQMNQELVTQYDKPQTAYDKQLQKEKDAAGEYTPDFPNEIKTVDALKAAGGGLKLSGFRVTKASIAKVIP